MIYVNVETIIQQKMEIKYDTLNNKIKQLKQNNERNSKNKNTTQHTFF
jgi:hypothetical protein